MSEVFLQLFAKFSHALMISYTLGLSSQFPHINCTLHDNVTGHSLFVSCDHSASSMLKMKRHVEMTSTIRYSCAFFMDRSTIKNPLKFKHPPQKPYASLLC